MQTMQWNKPARERHAHVSQVLAEILDGAPKAAIALCNYLFRTCIDGKLEEVELYNLALGINRITEKRQGRSYARNTLRSALKNLVSLGLVIIDKSYGRGVFRLTINHPGGKRPFDQFVKKMPSPSKNRPDDPEIDQTQPESIETSFPLTEEFREKAKQAAAIENYLAKEEFDSDWVNFTEEEFKNPPKEVEINTESTEICRAIREVMPLTPQLKAEALKYTLAQVENAIALYQERRQKKQISKPQGFLTDCLRGKWWLESGNSSTATSQYPPELVQWYALATEAGIVDGRPFEYCPGTSCRGGGAEHLQVAIPIPLEELQPNHIVRFRYLHWRDAIALYPLLGNSSQTEEPAEDFELDNYEPNPEIQRLIQESLGDS